MSERDEQGAPNRIWVQLHGDESPPFDGPIDCTTGDITWCWEPIFDHDVEYIRADLAAERERENKYLHEHHHICETAIGLARLSLQDGDTEAAKKALDEASEQINNAIRKHQPVTAEFMGLTQRSEHERELMEAVRELLSTDIPSVWCSLLGEASYYKIYGLTKARDGQEE